MSAWTGAPVLATLDASQIPAAPATVAAGVAAGFAAAWAVAANPCPATRFAFNSALLDARRNPDHDYGYSRAFLAAVELVKNLGGLT